MTQQRPVGASALAAEVAQWARAEAEDRELKSRVAAALDDIKEFVGRHQSDLEKRKSRLIQTAGFKDETRGMEAALAKINLLLAGRRNISVVFAAIDGFLDTYKGDETFDRDRVRTQLADASDEFICRFHDSIRGTRLAELLGIFYFMPYSCWPSPSFGRRNFRAPSSAEVSKFFEEFRRRGIELDGIDTVQIAAMTRIKLGITPRMQYHHMTANKLAEKLTSEEVITRFSTAEAPLDEGFCRTASGILANIRRWSAACFGSTCPPAPPEIEAEMLQIVFLATDTMRISGTESERSADYLWLLATVIASGHAALREVLAGCTDKHRGHPSVRERFVCVKTYLDEIATRADGILAARWLAAKEQLRCLTVRTDAIDRKKQHDFRDFTELEELKGNRSDVVKSLIKISESIQLIEPSLLDSWSSADAPAGRMPAGGEVSALGPAELRDRNYRYAEETRAIARRELEKLRLLVLRITAISRRGFADSGTRPADQRARRKEHLARKTSDGVETAGLSDADLHAKLGESIRKAALSLREFRSKLEGVRRRPLKSDLQHALNVLHDKTRRAAEACDDSDQEAGDAARAATISDRVAPLLRDIMTAQTSVGARMGTAKLTPAEKQPLTALLSAMKLRLGDDLRDLECLRSELSGRSAGTEVGLDGDSDEAAAGEAPEEGTLATPGAVADADDAARADDAAGAETAGTPQTAETPETARQDAPGAPAEGLADLVSSVGNALRPVKALMIVLNDELVSDSRDSQTILAAASNLKAGITEARDLVTATLMHLETLAAAPTLSPGAGAGKFDLWQGQLAALERETERLLKSMAGAAAVRQAVTAAAALEQGIVDTLTPPPAGRGRVEPFVPVRRRCTDALATIADLFKQVREAQDRVAAARDAAWGMLKAAPPYVGSLVPQIAASEQALHEIHARILAIHNRFKADRPRPR